MGDVSVMAEYSTAYPRPGGGGPHEYQEKAKYCSTGAYYVVFPQHHQTPCYLRAIPSEQ